MSSHEVPSPSDRAAAFARYVEAVRRYREACLEADRRSNAGEPDNKEERDAAWAAVQAGTRAIDLASNEYGLTAAKLETSGPDEV